MASENETAETEVLIIGSGPGGYVAAIRAAQHGLETTLVEKDRIGGVCLNRGCIPSKALVTASDIADEASTAEAMGIHADPAVDMADTTGWKDTVVDRLTGGVEKLCTENGVTLVDGTASFVDEQTVRITESDDPDAVDTIDFEYAIIATGSRPIQLPGLEFEHEHVWSSRDALAADSVPDRLVVVGGGYIGMELATIYAKLGADVTVVEMLDDILPQYEADVTNAVRRRAEELGIDFHLGEAANGWRSGPDGTPQLRTETADGDESTYPADRILVAVGRRPVTDTLELENVGLEPNENGFLETDTRGRTESDHIFAVGDVAGEPMLAHKASKEGIVAAEVIAGEPAAFDTRAVPAAVFTDPEIATVGMTESEAEDADFEPIVGEMPFRASGRALTTGHADGFVRIVADAETEFVLGGQIVGPDASELIAEVTLAIEMGATLDDLAATIHAHPTLTEAVMEAAENATDRAIHTLNR